LKNPLLSIIIPSHNSEKTIGLCVSSISEQSFPREMFEIIVVDDGSTDNTVQIAIEAGADQIIKTNPCSAGKARNVGVEKSKGTMIAFIDSDCRAKEGWLKAIVNELKTSDVVTGPVENGNPHSNVAWAEYFIEFGGYDKYRKKSYVRLFPGCNGALTREAFSKSGGFSDAHLSEDVMFGESLRQVGIKVLFEPCIRIEHLCRTDLDKVKANMKKLGGFFVKTRRSTPSIAYSSLAKSRWLVPIIFIGKISVSIKYALMARKFCKFLLAFPYVVAGITAFCEGIWEELGNQIDDMPRL